MGKARGHRRIDLTRDITRFKQHQRNNPYRKGVMREREQEASIIDWVCLFDAMGIDPNDDLVSAFDRDLERMIRKHRGAL